MIIAVDAGCLGVSDDRLRVGVYHFALNLLQNLLAIDRENKYLLYSFDPIPKDLLDKFGKNWSNLVLRPKKGWLNIRLSAEFLKAKPDIFLGLGQSLPLYHPAQNIVFVYDLAFELYPEFYADSYKRLSRQTKFAVKHAKTIVAISNSTKKDLVRLYKVDPAKIDVIYHGINSFTSASIDSSTPGKSLRNTPGVSLSLTKPYFLFVGSYKPVKNIPNIIKAFGLFIQKIQKPYQLILAGSDYWMDKEILKQVQDDTDVSVQDDTDVSVQDDNVLMLGYVPENDLQGLYKGATAFISPSYYEGFGIPILEAMSFGIPVIASDKGSIPEVTANAALLVDPDDVRGLSSAMRSIATDEKLRLELIKKGLIQAQNFSWEKSAKELLQIIKGMDPGSSPG